ncbi:uncharacterized protein LOC115626161 [Scaptodrosophila lebanonensis]|uniref:Uncharacterized protein LOC115626161 n=1 Tax=Drosophila lebanonensis TaxID=7225 RepID=A0A6J2TL20_DROLE|nr:uncharacterized protein LOC115626161 [Scaptodrosophila lebanonensis]
MSPPAMSKSSPARWVKFFNAAGIPSPAAAGYAHIFVENRIQDDMLLDLNKEYLREMGITLMGDIIAILRHAKQVSDQHALDRVLITDAPIATDAASPTIKPALPPAFKSLAISEPVDKASIAAKSPAPAKPARRVLPEHEGKYKVKLPLGTTERSKQILAKRDQLYSDRVTTSKKPDVFSRLHNADSGDDEEEQERIVSSSAETSSRLVKISGVVSKLENLTSTKAAATSSSSSVFARLGDKAPTHPTPAMAKEIKSILKNSQRVSGGTKINSPIIKAKSIVKPVVHLPKQEQKVMLVEKVPLKGGDGSDEESMEDDDDSFDDDYDDGESENDEDYEMDYEMRVPSVNQKIVKFASTAEVRKIATEKPRGNKNFAQNIKARLGLVSKLHATRKTYNLKASPTKKVVARLSPVKGKTIRMRSDEILSRQDVPVHKRLGVHPMTSAKPVDRPRERAMFAQRRNTSVHIGNKPKGQGSSVFDRLGFNNSL